MQNQQPIVDDYEHATLINDELNELDAEVQHMMREEIVEDYLYGQHSEDSHAGKPKILPI